MRCWCWDSGDVNCLYVTRAGKLVVVLDDGPIGGGQTARTTAHVSNVLSYRYYELEQIHGKEGAKLVA